MLLSSNIAETFSTQFLYNQYFYLNVNDATILSFVDKVESPTLLLNCVKISEGQYVSGFRAPFGGIECVSGENINIFVQDLLKHLSQMQAKSIVIKQAPTYFQGKESLNIHKALISYGFVQQVSEINQYIEVNPKHTFASAIDPQKRRRLNKAKNMGMRVELFNHIEVDDWYTVYTKSRLNKDFPITISKEAYYSLSENMPNTYIYAGVFINKTLIANAIFVRVNKDVLYYFLAGSDPEYAALSPTVLLIEALYEKALQEHVSTIDLGISSVNGILNEGLYQFKKHLAGKDCPKRTYEFVF